MQIEVGRGHEHDLAMLNQVLQQQQAAIQNGAPPGRPADADEYLSTPPPSGRRRAGFKSPELFWNDPSAAPPQMPKPNPEMAKVQVMQQDAQARAQEAQQRLQLDAQKAQMDSAHRDADRQLDAQVKMHDIHYPARRPTSTKPSLAPPSAGDQIDKEIALKGTIAQDQTSIQAAALDQADRHHVEDHLAGALGAVHQARVTTVGDSHRAALDQNRHPRMRRACNRVRSRAAMSTWAENPDERRPRDERPPRSAGRA